MKNVFIRKYETRLNIMETVNTRLFGFLHFFSLLLSAHRTIFTLNRNYIALCSRKKT